MPCHYPMVAEWTGEFTENNKKKYRFVGSALDPRYKDKEQDMIWLPCGQCIGCKLDYSRKWADRMILELQVMKKGVFCTLTYAAAPKNYSLNKAHLQNFMKEVRRNFPDVKCRFFASGEYGEKYHRPHMHVILFGLDMSDFNVKGYEPLEFCGTNELGQPYFRSNFFEAELWTRGNVWLSNVSWETCAYVARYTLKKLDHKEWDPEELGIQKEFSLMSRNPGIGAEYLKQHPECVDWSQIYLPANNRGIGMNVPEYYLRKVEEVNPDKFAPLREKRKKYAEDKVLAKLFGYEKRYDELLRDEERLLINRTKILKEGKV